MKRRLLLALALLSLYACNEDPTEMLAHMEGYWEIETVTLPDGTQKEYGFNNTIDAIELTDSLKGFRKKLMPNLRGSFETSKDAESFQLKIENDSLNVYYKTPFNTWKESILYADETTLRVVNQDKVQYLYKRYEPLKLD